MALGAVSLAALGAVVVWTLIAYLRSWYRLRHIPGPPFAAWSILWLLGGQLQGKLLQQLAAVSKRYGPIARIGPSWVVLSSPAEIRRIWSFRAGYRRSAWYAAFRIDPNNDSLLTAVDNRAHQHRRARVLPAYQGRGLLGAAAEGNQEAVVDGQVGKLVALLARKYAAGAPGAGGGGGRSGAGVPFDMARGMSYFTQDTIAAVEFGRPFGYLDADDDFFGAIRALEGVLLPCAVMGLMPQAVLRLATSRLTKPLMPKKTDAGGIGRLLGVIDERVSARYGDGKVRNADVLQLIVESGLSRAEVDAEALLHLFGGTDTTATSLRRAVFYLATSPPAYRRLQDEIDAAAERVTRPVVSDAECKELPFLQACIKETLRMLPPISGPQPKTSDDDDVICGVKVPAGTHVAIDWLGVMRNKEVFGDNADVYEPMRWLEAAPEQLKEMEATQGLCFAAGSRWECLGRRMANMQMGKLFLHFDFAMADPITPFKWTHLGITLHEDMNVIITTRKPKTDVSAG